VTLGHVNVGGGRKASQKSDFSDSSGKYIAAQAVNGSVLGAAHAETLNEAGAWWEVDLGSIQPIDSIDLDNVFGTDAARMSNLYLFVSDTKVPDTNTVAATLAQGDVSAWYRGAASSAYTYQVHRAGRYVRLQLTGTNFLQPREVRIWSSSLTIGALAKSPESH
jgi:hypothetical protein